MRTPLPKPKGLLFDKDGTLLDYTATFAASNIRVAKLLSCGDAALELQLLRDGGHDPALGRPRSGTLLAAGNLDELAEIWYAPTADSYAWPADIPAVMHLDALFQAHMTPKAVGDVAGLFDRFLASGLALGVATADSESGMRHSLKGLGILERCVYAAGFDTGHGRKPEPGMINAFADQISANPGEIWMIGDNAHDIQMGLNAGAVSIGVLTGTSSQDELQAVGAYAVFGSIHDLVQPLGL